MIFFIRIPSIPCGGVSALEGYHFNTDQEKLASYFTVVDSLGKINQHGCDLSYDRYYDSCFFLPFFLSHELSNYSPAVVERVLGSPTIKNSTKARLFLSFDRPTTYVLR